MDQRMYLEELQIHRYYENWHAWNNSSEEFKEENDEPEMPMVLILREEDEEAKIAPDIMGMM